MIITRQYLRDRNACYKDDRIAELVPEAGLTALEVADREDVPVEDRLWVLLHEDFISAKELRLFACRCARRALDAERAAGREPDARSWDAVAVAERFVRGEASAEELASAATAAWSAATAAATAAWSAATAAWSAATAAAAQSAWSAARAAARSVEQAEQLRDVREILVRTEAAK